MGAGFIFSSPGPVLFFYPRPGRRTASSIPAARPARRLFSPAWGVPSPCFLCSRLTCRGRTPSRFPEIFLIFREVFPKNMIYFFTNICYNSKAYMHCGCFWSFIPALAAWRRRILKIQLYPCGEWRFFHERISLPVWELQQTGIKADPADLRPGADEGRHL